MQKRIIDGIEVRRSSGNVFADLGLPDAETLKIKTGLAIEITQAMRRLGLSSQAAAELFGMSESKLTDMLRGRFRDFTEAEMQECLNRLGG